MNENQKNFLNELHDLLKKYAIDRLVVYHDSIRFESNQEILSFGHYDNGTFHNIETEVNNYTP